MELCDDGIYRWKGTVDMRHNPTILYLMLKILAFIYAVLFAIVFGTLFSGPEFGFRRLMWILSIIAPICLLVGVIVIVAYVIYAAVLGWVYTADYEMDETGLRFGQAPKEKRVARDVSIVTALIGAMTRSYGMVAASIAANADASTSVFAHVKSVKGIRKHGCIKLSQLTLYNQVYVAPEDYDFVFDFISARCPRAWVREA